MSNKIEYKKLLLGILIIIFMVLGISLIYHAGVFAYQKVFFKNIQIEHTMNHLKAEVKRISTVIESVQNSLEDLSNILEFQETTDDEQKILLQSVLFYKDELFGAAIAYEPFKYHKDSLYYSTYAHRSGDTILFGNLNGPAYNYFYKDWYIIPKTLQKPLWSEPYFDTGGGNALMTTYSVPIFQFVNNSEKFKGIATIDLSIDWLTKAIERYSKEYHQFAILISENGSILSSSDEKLTFNETIFTIAEEGNMPIIREIGRELQAGKSGHKKIIDTKDNKKWHAFYSSIQINKWGLIFLIPEEKLFDENFHKK